MWVVPELLRARDRGVSEGAQHECTETRQEALMNKLLAFASFVVLAGVLLSPAASAPSANRFSVHQEPRGIGNLVAPGDRVTLVYDAGVKSATGSVFVRNDLQRDFKRLPLKAEKGPSSTYRAAFRRD